MADVSGILQGVFQPFSNFAESPSFPVSVSLALPLSVRERSRLSR